MDRFTLFVYRVLNISLVQNPRNTSLGAFLGVIFKGLTLLFHPVIKQLKVIDISAVSLPYYIGLGVFVMNFPGLFKRREFDDSVEGAFAFIREAEKSGKMSDIQIRQMYMKLFTEILGKVKLNNDVSENIKKILSEMDEDIGRPSV